jgi:cobalt/nickel transport system permease protein
MHHHYIDRYAYGDSLIHQLDPRAKVIAILAYSVVLISFGRYQLPAPAFVIFPAILIFWSGTPLTFVLKHTLIVSPFILFVALASPWYDTQMVPSPISDGMIRAGWLTAATIVFRFVLSMSCLIALASTTPFPKLLAGLRRLGLPQILVMQLQFLYRYLFLLIDQAMHLRQARRARDAGRGSLAWRWKGSSGQLGVLMTRTLEQAERTHQAMLARGYDGEIKLLRELRWSIHDTLFLAGVSGYLIWLKWADELRTLISA